jgi:uncharacterized protein YndB with AHSA1/START domain
MVKSIKDEVRINADAKRVYEALTTEAGYRGWWNKVAKVPGSVGGEAQLHFVKDGQPVMMRYRIDEQQPNQSVRWHCVAHEFSAWIDTSLSWQIKEAGNACWVSFEHGGWKAAPPEPVIQGWKHFLGSLKSYLETGTGEPW